MDEEFSKESPDEQLRELHRFVQQAALHGYPNPERTGCPGLRVLDEVAAAPAPFKHPAYEHVKHCSPCLREMLDMRAAKLLARSKRRHRLYRIAIAAVLILAAGIGFMAWRSLGNRHERSTEIASISHLKRTADLFENPGPPRGSGEPRPQGAPIYLPPAALELRVILPRFSRPGTYRIAICREHRADTALVKAVGHTETDGRRQIVAVMLDLSELKPGSYWLATRNDENNASDYAPVKLWPGA